MLADGKRSLHPLPVVLHILDDPSNETLDGVEGVLWLPLAPPAPALMRHQQDRGQRARLQLVILSSQLNVCQPQMCAGERGKGGGDWGLTFWLRGQPGSPRLQGR